MKAPAIYYYVDHTSKFEHNSGIQRCVRSIAKALIELRQPLIPVVWDRSCQQLAPATQSDRSHLACWNGPPSQAWSQWKDVDPSESPWLLIVELVSGPNNPSREQLKAACHGMRIAWVFHDAIPVRWAHLYGSRAQQAATSHATYMRSLASYERVFCNSHTSRRHLLDFLTAQGRAGAKEQLSHILSLPLAEELSGDVMHMFDDGSGNIKNTSDILKKMMKNPAKIMELVKKISSKLDDKMKSGNISQEEIMKEAGDLMSKMNGMGNGKDFQNMMQNMMKTMGPMMGGAGKGAKMDMGKFNAMMGQNAAKERMRAKLQERKDYVLEKTENPGELSFKMPQEGVQEKSAARPIAASVPVNDDWLDEEVAKTPAKKSTKKKGKKGK